MEKGTIITTLEKIIAQVEAKAETKWDYHLELALKDALEDLNREDREDNIDMLSKTIADYVTYLLDFGVDPESIILLANSKGLIAKLEDFIWRNIEIDSAIKKIIADIDKKEFHDEFLKTLKTWKLPSLVNNYYDWQGYLSTSEIADLLFNDRHDYVWDYSDYEYELKYEDFRNELAKIAIKEDRVFYFIVFIFPKLGTYSGSDIDEILPFFKSLIDKGANKKDILYTMLWKMKEAVFSDYCMEALAKYDLDLTMISDKVIEFLADFGWFPYISENEPIGLSKFIESLDEKSSKELFDKTSPGNIDNLWYYCDESCSEWGTEPLRRVSEFYLDNVPELEGENPIYCMKYYPREKLLTHKRSKEFKEYLKRVINDEEFCEYWDEDCIENGKLLLALLEK